MLENSPTSRLALAERSALRLDLLTPSIVHEKMIYKSRGNLGAKFSDHQNGFCYYENNK